MDAVTSPQPSLRRRLRRWIAAVLAITLLASTLLRIADERRRVMRAEREGATSFVDRLARMPEMQRSAAQARTVLDAIDPLLRSWRARVDLVPAGTPVPPDTALLVARALPLPEGRFELRYRVSDAYLSAAARRAVIFHAVHGALTFVVLLAGVEWILRRRLLTPLHQLSHQIDHMRAGGGWQPVLPATDAEFAEIAAAIRELGPGLSAQVDEWIQGEKRAAVAMALGGLRKRLADSRRPASAVARDLEACEEGGRGSKARLLILTHEMVAVDRVIDSLENDLLPKAQHASSR